MFQQISVCREGKVVAYSSQSWPMSDPAKRLENAKLAKSGKLRVASRSRRGSTREGKEEETERAGTNLLHFAHSGWVKVPGRVEEEKNVTNKHKGPLQTSNKQTIAHGWAR